MLVATTALGLSDWSRSPMDNRLEALERLSRLRETGALTEEEFAAEKAKLLDPSRSVAVAGTDNSPIGKRRWLSSPRARIAVAVAGLAIASAFGAWWWFSPYWTLREMQAAYAAKDAEALAEYIDFPGLRNDLKADAFAEMAAEANNSKGDGSGGLAMLGAAMVGPLIDGAVSPEGLRALLAMKSSGGQDFGLKNIGAGGGDLIRTGLSEFRFKAAKGDTLVFTLQGLGWKLSGIDHAPSSATKVGPSSAPPSVDLPGEEPVPSAEPARSNDIIGSWANVAESCGAARDNISFSADGQYQTQWTDGYWSVEGDTLVLSQSEASNRVPFSISSGRLTLSYDDGPITYQRCG